MRVLALLLAVFALVNSQSESFCAFDLRDIEVHINESMNGVVTDFFLNCLAQNGSHFAESISLSAFTSVDQGVRYDFQCYEGSTLIPTISMNVSIVYNHACSSCNFSLVDDPCEGSECADHCGSCSDNSETCTSCRYLVSHDDHSVCLENTSCETLGFEVGEAGCDYHPDYTRLVHVGYVRKRKSGNNKYQKECPEGHFLEPTEPTEDSPQYLLPNKEVVYHCVERCSRQRFMDVTVEGEAFCYACGIENCINCDLLDVCLQCVEGYHPYQHSNSDYECITEEEFEEKNIEEQTEELEHEQEEEEDEQEENNLLLKILLPLFCTLTVIVFVGISVFAHYWYPYLDSKGDYRSKTPPAFVREPTVWRPRPTVRYR